MLLSKKEFFVVLYTLRGTESMQTPQPGWVPGNMPGPPLSPYSRVPQGLARPRGKKLVFWIVCLTISVLILLVAGLLHIITSAQGGSARLGGSVSDFTAKYGSPLPKYGENTPGFEDTNLQTIIIIESFHDNHVDRLEIFTPSGWDWSKRVAYCSQFLPSDAKADTTVGNPLDGLATYHSSLGEVDMVMGIPQCEIYFNRTSYET
jgi:hypothetical protein